MAAAATSKSRPIRESSIAATASWVPRPGDVRTTSKPTASSSRVKVLAADGAHGSWQLTPRGIGLPVATMSGMHFVLYPSAGISSCSRGEILISESAAAAHVRGWQPAPPWDRGRGPVATVFEEGRPRSPNHETRNREGEIGLHDTEAEGSSSEAEALRDELDTEGEEGALDDEDDEGA